MKDTSIAITRDQGVARLCKFCGCYSETAGMMKDTSIAITRDQGVARLCQFCGCYTADCWYDEGHTYRHHKGPGGGEIMSVLWMLYCRLLV